MDEEDERMLMDCIMEKGTAHGRRHDSVIYLNHRVKKKDFLKIVNVSRKRRELPLIKSATTAYTVIDHAQITNGHSKQRST